jgi:poly(3-hydroxybutyrate) depolymerase
MIVRCQCRFRAQGRLLTLGLFAAAALLGAASPASAKLNQSNWDRICANSAPATWEAGGAYSVTGPRKANCRVLPAVDGDERDRRYVVTVPRSALERRRAPVLFFFHGTSGTGEQYWKISRWRELAHRHGFVAVFPTALGYDLNTDSHPRAIRVWNSIGQACDAVDPDALADDVAFVRAIHADLAAQLRLDPRRVHAAGFSNGSQMVHRLAAEAGDLFASVAGWAGPPTEGDNTGAQCPADPYGASALPIPVWNGIGAIDDRFGGPLPRLPLRPGLIELALPQFFADASLLYSVAPSRTRELPISDLVRIRPLGGFRPRFSPVLAYDALPGNAAGNEYLFVIQDGLIHHYPNAWPGRRNRAQTEKSRGVTMAALHFQWLRDNPKAG